MRTFKFWVYNKLNNSQSRFLLGAVAATYATLRAGRGCRAFYDGEWIQRFPTGTLVGPCLTLHTLKEIEESARDLWMFQYLPAKGDVVIDVGAGTGWETLAFASRVGDGGQVISIEAHPRVFACLSRMQRENQLKNVTLINVAVMDKESSIVISDSEDHLQNRVVGIRSGISVPATTLDLICCRLQLSKIDLLKMNIEGAEKYALAGMTEMIRKTKNICVSCHDFVANQGGSEEMRTKAEVVAFLQSNGFDVFVRESDTRAPVQYYVYGRNLALCS